MSAASVAMLTESPTADTASGDPLDELPLRQFVVFVVRANRRSLPELAKLFGVHRDRLYVDLKRAITALAGKAPATLETVRAQGRGYSCRRHRGRDCPAGCTYLRQFLREFDAAMPVVRDQW